MIQVLIHRAFRSNALSLAHNISNLKIIPLGKYYQFHNICAVKAPAWVCLLPFAFPPKNKEMKSPYIFWVFCSFNHSPLRQDQFE